MARRSDSDMDILDDEILADAEAGGAFDPKPALPPSGLATKMAPSPNPEDYSLVRIIRVNSHLLFRFD